MERNTRQRGAIRRAFQRAYRPLSTNEVLDLARGEVTGLGIATVYRNIRALVEEGWLVTVELPGDNPRYELEGKGHHHHFHCSRCDRVFDVTSCNGIVHMMIPPGFVLDRHLIVLSGLCVECAAAT